MAATKTPRKTPAPLLQLYNQVFPPKLRRRKGYALLGRYIRQGGSVFTLVEKGVHGLVRDFGISPTDAQHFLRRANALAFHVQRQFIEQTLTGAKPPQRKPLSGPLSMVEGPSYEQLFSTDFDALCPPDALESITSPVAYLIWLLMRIRNHIEPHGDKDNQNPDLRMMPLMDRRRDIEPSLIDFISVHQSVSSVDIIIPVLETFIKAHSEGDVDVDDAMSEARFPNGMPYSRAWTTIDFVARHHDLSVGEMARVVDPASPYFLSPYGWGGHAGRALLQALGLGPYQQALLIESPLNAGDDGAVERFYTLNFGTYGLEHRNIYQVPFFCEKTKLEARQLEALLSIRSFAPTRSANVPLNKNDASLIPTGAQSGSVYLNAGETPSVGIDFGEDAGSFLHRLTDWSNSRVDRMNRKLRLDQWLGLPPDQVDALLMAAINAEAHAQPPEHKCWISNNTLQAIGLFQELRERCGCSAEDFAVFIHELSIFGRGEVLSQFDRVFNAQPFSSEPLQIGDCTFPVSPAPGEEGLTVHKICHALGINLHTYRHLAEAIAQALGRKQTLERDVKTLSSFFRMVKLPRMLGITPVEAIVLLMTLGGVSWLNALAGVPRIQSNKQPGIPSVLDVIYGMNSCVDWCTEHELPMAWMLQQVTPNTVPPAASSDERQLFEHLQSLLSAALFSNAALLMAGVPPLAGGADWLDLLAALVDHKGLVLTQAEANERDYLTYARELLDVAVRAGIGEGDAASRAPIVEKMLEVLLLARAGQVSVVKECLALYAGLRSELVVLVLTWAGGTVYQVLGQALEQRVKDDEVSAYRRRAEDEAGGLLILLAEVRRRSAVAVKFDLGTAVLEDHLSYGYRAWMNLEDKHELSLSTLYYLTVLTQAFALGVHRGRLRW